MARDKKKRTWRFTSRETTNAIFGVLSILSAVFLLMSAFGLAGQAGEFIFKWLYFLFGIGYYALPLVFILLAVSLMREEERELALPQAIGSILLFLSILGLINLVSDRGGVVGGVISRPLETLFHIYFSALVFVSLAVISLLIIFNAPVKFDALALLKKIWPKTKESLEPVEAGAVQKAVEKMEATEIKNQEKSETPPREAPKEKGVDGFEPEIKGRRGLSTSLKTSRRWAPPPLSLLEGDRGKPGVGDIKANANLIKRTLLNFGIVVEMDEISIGPSVTRYALKPAEGVKLSKILGLQNNLELALAAHPVRIEAPIPGKSLVGIEVPNTMKSTVGLGSLISDEEYAKSSKPLLFSLGRDIAGHSHFANLAKMPHVLIAGATGSGKSVTIHAIVTSLLFRNPPENLKFIMIDPKRVELTLYNNIPHLLTPVITDPKKAILALKWVAKEMERRYDILEKSSARDIESYHSSTKDESSMPLIVIIIDELADLMQSYPRELEAAVVRLAQISRAVGIHIILSTQRPSVNIITGLIKANIPARIALQVASQIDSRTILDAGGAEKLLGAGDMLFLSGDMSKPLRIQSAFISEKEVKSVVKYLKENYADEEQEEVNFSGDNTTLSAEAGNAILREALEDDSFGVDDDELYEEARKTVLQAGKASTSFLQRKLRIGYARAARLMDMLEERGVVGAGSGAKPREVIGAGTVQEIEEPLETEWEDRGIEMPAETENESDENRN